jgi:hypothetical protein
VFGGAPPASQWPRSREPNVRRLAADHCLADLLYRHSTGELACDIVMIISNHPTAKPLADCHHVPFHLLTNPKDKGESEREMLELFGRDVDLIVLARYMQILGPDFVAQYLLRMINIHPSFFPLSSGRNPMIKPLPVFLIQRLTNVVGGRFFEPANLHSGEADLPREMVLGREILTEVRAALWCWAGNRAPKGRSPADFESLSRSCKHQQSRVFTGFIATPEVCSVRFGDGLCGLDGHVLVTGAGTARRGRRASGSLGPVVTSRVDKVGHRQWSASSPVASLAAGMWRLRPGCIASAAAPAAILQNQAASGPASRDRTCGSGLRKTRLTLRAPTPRSGARNPTLWGNCNGGHVWNEH